MKQLFTASFDNRYATANKNKRTKHPEFVGNKYDTKQFSTVARFIEYSKLDCYDSTAYGSFFSLDKVWQNIDDSTKSYAIRPIKINTEGFQLCFLDVDTEYFNGQYCPSLVEDNLNIIKDTNCAFVLKSSSYGKIPDDVDELDKNGKKKYPLGKKMGKRILWILDCPILTSDIKNYFTQEEITTIASNLGNYEKYILIRDGRGDEIESTYLNNETLILEQIYEFIVIELAKRSGLSDGTNHGFDVHSLTISQKMMGSAQGFLVVQETRVDSRPLLKEAITYIKSKFNVNRDTTNLSKTAKMYGNALTFEDFDGIEFDADVATLMCAFVPKRIKGSGSYGNYFKLVTALKQLNVNEQNILALFDNLEEGQNVYNSVKPIFDDPMSMVKKIITKDMGISLIHTKNHNTHVYKREEVINDRYLSSAMLETLYKQGERSVVIQSIHNTGKTFMLKDWIPFLRDSNLKLIYVCHLRSILRTTSHKLGLAYYEDNLESDIGICITPDSFHRLDGVDFTNCIVVIDEHTQVIRKMAGDYMKSQERNYYKSLKILWKAIETCKMMVALDADDYIGVPELMKNKPVKIKNSYKTDKMNLQFFRWAEDEHYEDRVKATKKEYCSRNTHAFEKIVSLLREGKKLAIPCSKKSTAKKLDAFLKKNGFSGFCLMSETEEKNVIFDHIAFNKVSYQYCIYTYTAWTGFDVSVGSHSIDLVVAIFEGVAGLNHDDMAQAMRRFRGVSEGIVYGQWTASCKLLPFDLFMQERKKKENAIMKSSLMQSFDDVDIMRLDEKFHNILLYVNYLDRVYANYVSFTEFCSKIGTGPITYEGNDWRPTKETQSKLGAIKRENNVNDLQEFIEAEYLTPHEYNKLFKMDRTHKQNVQLSKTTIARAIGRKQLDALVNSGLIDSTRDLKWIGEILNNYLLKDTMYQLALLKYKARYLPEWDKDSEKLQIKLLMGDVKKGEFDAKLKLADKVHGLLMSKVNNQVGQDFINQLTSLCLDIRTETKASYASIKMGDTMVGETVLGVNVESTTHESVGDGKFIKSYESNPTRLINQYIGKFGYYLDKKRVRRRGHNGTIYTVIIDPLINILLSEGSPEYIYSKMEPRKEIEMNFTNDGILEYGDTDV